MWRDVAEKYFKVAPYYLLNIVAKSSIYKDGVIRFI